MKAKINAEPARVKATGNPKRSNTKVLRNIIIAKTSGVITL